MLDRLISFRFAKISSGLSLPTARTYAARFGLAQLDWRVLSTLKHHGPMTVNEIAAKIYADKGNVSRSVAALLRDARIVRRPCHDDGRKAHLELSAIGLQLFEEINPMARAREARMLSALNAEERKQLECITAKLLAQLERMGAEPLERAP